MRFKNLLQILTILGLSALIQTHAFAQSLSELHEAANKGDTGAYYLLGRAYQTAHFYGMTDEDIDIAEAIKWYRKAAETDGNGITQLINIYLSGENNFPAQPNEAVKFCIEFALKGKIACQQLLAKWYSEGKYVKTNYAQALHWQRMAAKTGYIEAQRKLADMLTDKKYGTPDFAAAVELWKKVAQDGNVTAARSLADVYLTGAGDVDQDLEKAYWWLSVEARMKCGRHGNLNGIKPTYSETCLKEMYQKRDKLIPDVEEDDVYDETKMREWLENIPPKFT